MIEFQDEIEKIALIMCFQNMENKNWVIGTGFHATKQSRLIYKTFLYQSYNTRLIVPCYYYMAKTKQSRSNENYFVLIWKKYN